MNILVLGSGGREHALASLLLGKANNVHVYPGNDGMFLQESRLKTCQIAKMEAESIAEFCQEEKIDLVVVGPENLLADGVGDYLRNVGIATYGPSAEAAKLESSKIFSKELMKNWDIPTAEFMVAENHDEAVAFIESNKFPIEQGLVLKADGLAAGKGVVVTFSKEEALNTAYDFMENKNISVKSKRLLIERCLKGKELSAFAICDGNDYFFLGTACDYKRVNDGDEGPNTGGMGCYTPKEWPGKIVEEKIKAQVIEPVLKAMRQAGNDFVGTLFCGLMVDGEEINVIEFNVRFGDPETQTILPLVNGDFADLLYHAARGKLAECNSHVSLKEDKYAVHLVKTSGGYPSIDGTPMDLGNEIYGTIEQSEELRLYFAGVKNVNGVLTNNGGRVLGITALGKDLKEARNKAYQEIKKINFKGEHYRNDIALMDKK